MTDIEKAIRRLDDLQDEFLNDDVHQYTDLYVFSLAISALKEKQDRDRGCGTCKEYKKNRYALNFCPDCGKKLEVEK